MELAVGFYLQVARKRLKVLAEGFETDDARAIAVCALELVVSVAGDLRRGETRQGEARRGGVRRGGVACERSGRVSGV